MRQCACVCLFVLFVQVIIQIYSLCMKGYDSVFSPSFTIIRNFLNILSLNVKTTNNNIIIIISVIIIIIIIVIIIIFVFLFFIYLCHRDCSHHKIIASTCWAYSSYRYNYCYHIIICSSSSSSSIVIIIITTTTISPPAIIFNIVWR